MLKKIALMTTLSFACASALAGAGGLIIDSNKKPIKVYPQQPFTLALTSNPSTGYSWYIVKYDKNLVTLNSQKFMPSGSKLVGAPGQQIFAFTANTEQKICGGKCAVNQVGHITLKYARSWEMNKAKPTNFTVIIHK